MSSEAVRQADDTKGNEERDSFIVTKEYRRFAEFCDACLREKYIGICYGQPGVGKTASARFYSKWFFLENRLPRHLPYQPLPQEVNSCRTILYTAEMSNPHKKIRSRISEMGVQLTRFVEESSPNRPRYHIVSNAIKAGRYLELIIVDETERLKIDAIEQFREIYDKKEIGLIFIGMQGLEKKLSRYPQLYSRIGFAHHYQPLTQEEMRFLLSRYWERLGLTIDPNDFTDNEAIVSIARITNGNFRLLDRLFRQIGRIIRINGLKTITAEIVEAARECLVIGKV